MLVDAVEAATLDQALGQAEGHGGVICPLAGLQVERLSPHYVGEQSERARTFKLHGRAKGIAKQDREALPGNGFR